MACRQTLFWLIVGSTLVATGCAGSGGKTICKPVPSFASPAVQCMAIAEPKPPPPPPVAKPEPKPEPEPEPEPEPPPVVVKKEAIELDRTVQFETNSAVLVEDSKSLLDEVAKALEEHPEVKVVQIEGHTDSVQSKKKNKKLSVKRANAVRAYLVEKGIAKARLMTKGFGEDVPVADNKTEEGRFKNRRVDLKITKRDDSEAASAEETKGSKDSKPEKPAKASKDTESDEAAKDETADEDEAKDDEAKESGKKVGKAGKTRKARKAPKPKDADE